MRIGSTRALAAELWFTHAATPVMNEVDTGDIGPHAVTVRATATIPAGRHAWVDFVYLRHFRVTAAAPVGRHAASFLINGGPLAMTQSLDNVVASAAQAALNSIGYLRDADTLAIDTFDLGTGGTVRYLGGFKRTEYIAE